MPHRPPSPCLRHGCPNLTRDAYCPNHTRTPHPYKRRRQKLYNTARWRRLSEQIRRQHPWCQAADCTNMATDVDHIDPEGELYDPANLQTLCKRHHSRKTQQEVFGRKG